MISLSLAGDLKVKGLEWRPALHDFFSIPDSDLDNRIFVVSDMMIDIQQLFGREIITFNGAVEWSLDHIMMADALWMPTEAQLRKLVQDQLADNFQSSITLQAHQGSCSCQLTAGGIFKTFEADGASDAYALALLFLLNQRP